MAEPLPVVVTDNQKTASAYVSKMIAFMLEREKAGGYSTDDVITMIKLWAKIGTLLNGPTYIAHMKRFFCGDYTPNPDIDTTPRHDPNWPDEDPKASKELFKRLTGFTNTVLTQNEPGKNVMFNLTESGLGRLVWTYEVKLARDAAGTKIFRRKLNQLRHSHSLE